VIIRDGTPKASTLPASPYTEQFLIDDIARQYVVPLVKIINTYGTVMLGLTQSVYHQRGLLVPVAD